MDQEIESFKSVAKFVLFPGTLHIFCFCDSFIFTIFFFYSISCLL